MSQSKNSILGRIRVGKLSYGIHDNIVITNVDTKDRKTQSGTDRKMIYITFTSIDPESKKKLAETELSWFKLDDHTNERLFSDLQNFCVQLHGILACYMSEDKAFDALEPIFDDAKFSTLSEMESHKWKKKELIEFLDKIKEVFGKAIAPYVNNADELIRVKLVVDNKGEYINIPKYGVFTESMDVKPSNLKFTDYERRNISKAGTTTNNADES